MEKKIAKGTCACCAEPQEKGVDFLDRDGLLYLCELLKVGMEHIADKKITELEMKIDAKLDELEARMEKKIKEEINDAVSIEGDILKIRLADGTYREIDLSKIGTGGSGNIDLASDADIDAFFH